MKRLLSLLPAAGVVAGSALAVALLSASPSALAQACKVNSTDGSCQNEGARCTTGGKKGKCKTLQPGVREFTCACSTGNPRTEGPRTDGPRSDPRPRGGEPEEQPEEEPQEELPEA